MRIWSMSFQGNIASQRQTTALASEIALACRSTAVTMQHFTPQAPEGATKVNDNLLLTWGAPLSPHDLSKVVCPEGILQGPWPDMVVSCRPEIAAVALGIKEASGGACKIVQIQNPNDKGGVYRFNRSAFDAIVAQPQEDLCGPNVITTKLALHGLTPAILAQKRAENAEICRQHNLPDPMRPMIAYMVGGSDETLRWGNKAFAVMADHIIALAQKKEAPTVCVLTSRRTGADGTRILHERLRIGKDGKSGIAGLDIRLNAPENYFALITHAHAIVVTSESLSMVSEAAMTGKPVFADSLNGLLAGHPTYPFICKAADEGMIKLFTAVMSADIARNGPTRAPVDETPAVARRVLQQLGM